MQGRDSEGAHDMVRTALIGPVLIAVALYCAPRASTTSARPYPTVPTVGQSATLSDDSFARVVQRLFPRAAPTTWRTDWWLTLRFPAREEPATRINMLHYIDGHIEVDLFQTGITHGTLRESVDRLLASGVSAEPDAIAARISVERVRVPDSAAIRGLLARLSPMTTSVRLDSSITLDGAVFELWSEAGQGSVHLDLVGQWDQDPSPRDPSIVRWMKQVRTAVLAGAAKSSANRAIR